MAENDMELVAIFRAQDEASPVLQDLSAQFALLDRTAGETGTGGVSDVSEKLKRATDETRDLRTGLGGLSTVLRLVGLGGAAQMVTLANSILRVGRSLRTVQGIGGLGALGGPTGLAVLGGLALAGGTAALIASSRARAEARRPTAVVTINVDARGTVTEHRALADEIARQVEASVSSRVRFAGGD